MDGNQNPWGTSGRPPLRDWQKDTWTGPTPSADTPFDEPEDAPELREMRSESLNNRSGAFWENGSEPQITGGYRFGGKQTWDRGDPNGMANPSGKTAGRDSPGETGALQMAGPSTEEKKRTAERKRPVGLIFLGILALVVALITILYFGVFSVREITVIGNSQIPAGEIIRLSGIRTGTPIFSIRREEVEQRLKQNPLLKFRYLEKEMPSRVVLAVREREACCWMTWNGILYAMDKQRMVLYETEDLTVRPASLVRVDGLDIRSTARVGQSLVLETSQQVIFSNLFLEMKVLGCTELIEEADLSNISSLLLTTRDGFTVAMGDGENIHAKLRAMLATREELLRRGYRGGVINVMLPEAPIFSPSATP